MEEGTSGFLSISDFNCRVSAELEQDLRPHRVLRNGTPLATRDVHGVTGHLVELYLEPEAFSGRCNWGVSAPSCCDFILWVTLEEVPGQQDLP